MTNLNAAKIEAEIQTDRNENPIRIDINPDQIGRMSQKAIEACEHSATLLRELGDYAGQLGQETKDEIYRLATDFEEHGRTAARQVVNYAQDIFAKATQARELRNTLPNAGPRIVNKS